MGRCSLGASNTSVTTDIKSGYSTPDCSVPDLCRYAHEWASVYIGARKNYACGVQ
jgi:hypothetical protein